MPHKNKHRKSVFRGPSLRSNTSVNAIENTTPCSAAGYKQPTTLLEFEAVYRKEYEQQLESCDGWIKWCERQNPPDTHGVNFHQGMRSAHVFNNIKMEQLIRVLKQEQPNDKVLAPKGPQ